LVSLVQNPELEMMGIPHFFDKVKAYGIQSIHYPIPDKWLPNSMDEVSELVNRIIELLHRGKRIVVHCNGGKGRTALVVVSVLVSLGMSAGEATDLVRATRPGTLYNPAQIIYVRALGLYRG
jgi:ADP-ribosyl-[dinitrogen reductase] hydrolase